MNCGLKYLRESIPAVRSLKCSCQVSAILSLMRFLKDSFSGGLSRRVKGWGRPYLLHRERIWENQHLSSPSRSFCFAILCRMFSGSRDIIPNKVSCFRCRVASPGNVPDTMKITTSGVLWWSLRRSWTVCFTWWETMSTSVLLRMRDARPEKRTGVPNILSALIEDKGFARWRRDIPVKRTQARAFLCLTNLWCMCGRLPDTDLITPTCSAESTKGMVVAPMWTGLISLAYFTVSDLPGEKAKSLVFAAERTFAHLCHNKIVYRVICSLSLFMRFNWLIDAV